MCGIVGIFNVQEQTDAVRQKALEMSRRIRHRGPDWSGIWCGGSAVLAHERLSIVDPKSGGQPLLSPDGKLVLAVNGEIYNHQEIRRRITRKSVAAMPGSTTSRRGATARSSLRCTATRDRISWRN